MDRPADNFTVAVIRAWIEPETGGALRVRIIRDRPGAEDEDTIGVTSDIREAGRIVERWLAEFVAERRPRAVE